MCPVSYAYLRVPGQVTPTIYPTTSTTYGGAGYTTPTRLVLKLGGLHAK
jgi:hypothetical protein